MKKNTKPDLLWLAQTMVNAVNRQVSVDDFLQHAKTTLPAAYHPSLASMSISWQRDKSLPNTLRTLNHNHVTQLATALEQSDQDPMSLLTRWNSGILQLQRIKSGLKSVVTTRLFYLTAVLVVWSNCFSVFLLHVVPNYVDWYANSFSSDGGFLSNMPPVTRFMVSLAMDDAWFLIRQLIFWSGPIGVIYYFISLRKLKRLMSTDSSKPATFWFPWLKPYINLTQLYEISLGVERDLEKIKSLTTVEQHSALKMADQFGYLQDEASQMFNSPEQYWTQRITQQFHRLTTVMTVMLWILIALFVFGVYQPIFQLGTVS